MPQSYDFIFKPARDFCEKLQKKLEIAFFYPIVLKYLNIPLYAQCLFGRMCRKVYLCAGFMCQKVC